MAAKINRHRCGQNYVTVTACRLRIVDAGGAGGRRVRVYVVDLDLATDADGSGCASYLNVFDGLRSVTLCGSRSRRLLATSARQRLQVRFHGNRQQRPLKGFWLYYEGKSTIQHNMVFTCAKMTAK